MLLSRLALRIAVATTTLAVCSFSIDADAAKPKKQAGKKSKKEEPPAEAGPRRVAVVITGPKAKDVRGWVRDELEGDDIELIPEKEAKGIKPDADNDAFVKFATKREVAAIVAGVVEKEGKNWVLTLQVRNGADGEVLGETTFKGKSPNDLKKKIGAELAVNVADPIVQAKAPSEAKAEPEPEPEPEKEPEPEAEPEKEEPAAKEEEPKEEEEEDDSAAPSDLRSAVEVGLGLKGFRRSFDYNDDIAGLRTYSLDGAPAVFVWLRLYPAAFSSDGFISNIGLAAGYEQSFALNSKDSQGQELSTSSNEFYAGLRLRVPLSEHELGVTAAYGKHSFIIEGDVSVPDVDYSFIRLVVDGEFRLSDAAFVGLSVGPRIMLGTGQLGEIFPDASSGGLEAGLFGGYAVSPSFDLMLGLELRRYFFTLHPNPQNPPLLGNPPQIAAAGGATDQYLGVWLGVAWHNR